MVKYHVLNVMRNWAHILFMGLNVHVENGMLQLIKFISQSKFNKYVHFHSIRVDELTKFNI